MLTGPLPTPVRVVVDLALRAAVRRWPPHLRDEMAAEWAAELHAIAHDPATRPAQRSWRSLTYTVSLAFARGIEQEPTRGYDMRRVLRPALTLVAVPPLIAAFVIGTPMAAIRVGWETGLTRNGATDPGSFEGQAPVVDLAPVVALVCVIAVGLAGRWLGKRVRLPVAAPTVRVGVGSALLVAGFGAALVAAIPFESPVFGFAYGSELLGFIVWGALLPPVMVAGSLLVRWSRVGAVALTCLGGTVAYVAGAQAAGTSVTKLPQAFVQWWLNGLFPHVLLATTIFAVTYLTARRLAAGSEASPVPGGVTA